MGYGVADTGVDFDFISIKDAHALLKSDGAIFVDSRDAEDFRISRIQTSYNFPANDIMFKQDRLDKSLVQRCQTLVAKGKLVVVVSDAGIPGIANRGHVSRCRHVAQYLHELGVEREAIRRLQGGVNRWKRSGLDGILGDMRRYYAGAVMNADREAQLETEALEELAAGEPQDGLERAALGAPPQAPHPEEASEAVAASLAASLGEEAPASAAASRPLVVTNPTVYRVLRGEVFKKASPDAEKIIKLDWATDRLVRTTGEIFTGASGGRWAELDTGAGEKRGWVYIEGPGFGPTTRKIITEFLAA